jgi:uncharacterized protein (TIGR04255 family)
VNPKPIPKKLKHDAIVEALLEIRFDTEAIPEVLFGRLVDHPSWKGFAQRRLPAYDIPAPMRQADENFRYQPLFELKNAADQRLLRVGPQVLSYHQLAPYPGWLKFRPCLHEAVDQLFAKAGAVTIRRLGFRYVNALRPDLHGISGMADLDIDVRVSNDAILSNVNVNYTRTLSDEMLCTVRVATTEFVQGALPPAATTFIDVDVFTKGGFQTSDSAEVKTWVETAHEREKESFFDLLKVSTIEALRED